MLNATVQKEWLCFTCDEKFYLINRCPIKHYFLLQIEKDYMDNHTLEPFDIIENMETFTL